MAGTKTYTVDYLLTGNAESLRSTLEGIDQLAKSVAGTMQEMNQSFTKGLTVEQGKLMDTYKKFLAEQRKEAAKNGKSIFSDAQKYEPIFNIKGNFEEKNAALQTITKSLRQIQRLKQQGTEYGFTVKVLTGQANRQLQSVIDKADQVRTAVTKPMAISITAKDSRSQLSNAVKNLKAWTTEVKNLGGTLGMISQDKPAKIAVTPEVATNAKPIETTAEVTKIINKLSEAVGSVGVEGIINGLKWASRFVNNVDLIGTVTEVKNAASKINSLEVEGIVSSVKNAANKINSIEVEGLVKTIKTAEKIQALPIDGVLNSKQLNEQIQAFKPTPLSVPIKLGFGKGEASRASQFKNLQEGMKPLPMEVKLDISQALEQLNKLKEAANGMNPLNISANVSSGANKGTKGSKGSSNTTPKTALTPQNIASSIGKQFGEKPSLYTSARKNLYPFTGNTSFGARTPMALDMAKGMGVMFAVSGVMSAVTDSFKQVAEYENSMKTVRAILSTTDGGSNFNNRFGSMQSEIRRIGRTTKFTAPEVAGAARFMAMAGLKTEDIKAASNPIANLALVGDTDLATTADKMTNIMTAFQLLRTSDDAKKRYNMNHTADILTNTFARSNTDLMQTAEAMQYVAPIAHMLGLKIEEVSAMIGVLGNSGIQSSSAGTSIRMMMQNILKPSKAQAEEWKALGIKTINNNGVPRDIFDILKDLRARLTGTTDLHARIGVDNLKLIGAKNMRLFRTTAGAGAATLLENLGDVIDLTQSNASANGMSQRIANEKKNTIQGLWAQVTSTFTDQSVDTVTEFQKSIKEMLVNLRDWLASKEAADTLKNIYTMAEQLLDVFSWVADKWKDIYSWFPGVVNTFIKFQFVATQIGFLVTPFVQLIGAVSTLRKGLFGLGAALGVASAATNASSTANNTAATSNVISSVVGATATANAGKKLNKVKQLNNIGLLSRAAGQGRLSKSNLWRGVGHAFTAGFNAMSLMSIGPIIKSTLTSMALYASKIAGALISPLGLAGIALTAFVAILWKANSAADAARKRFDNWAKSGVTVRNNANKIINERETSGYTIKNPVGAYNDAVAGMPMKSYGQTGNKFFMNNPMLMNSQEWKSAFMKNSQQAAVDRKIYDTYIKPNTGKLFGRQNLSLDWAKIMYQRQNGLTVGTYLDNHAFISRMRDKVVTSQVALSDNQFKKARAQAIKVWQDYSKLSKEKQTPQAEASARTKVENIAQQFSKNAKGAPSLKGKNLGTMRVNDVSHSMEGYTAMADAIRSYNDPQNSITGPLQLGQVAKSNVSRYQLYLSRIMSTINLQMRDINGQIVNFQLPGLYNGNVNWNILIERLKLQNVNIENSLKTRMGFMLQLYDIIKNSAELSKKYAGMKIGDIAAIMGGTVHHNDVLAGEDRDVTRNNIMGWFSTRSMSWKKKYGYDKMTPLQYLNSRYRGGKLPANLVDIANKWKLNQLTGNETIASGGNGDNTTTAPGGKNLGNQDDYKSKYNHTGARPTQIIFNIGNLCEFKDTKVGNTSQDEIARTVGLQMAHGLEFLFAQAASDYELIGNANA